MSAITLDVGMRAQRQPRLRTIVWVLDLAVLLAALVAFASIPTGSTTAAGVAPSDGRVVVQQAVGSARALVVSRPQTLQLIVAIHKQKGWFGLRVADTSSDGIAWASTAGTHGVPSMSVVFGRAAGPIVRIRWADGEVQTVQAQSDGAFLAVRPGEVRSVAVSMLKPSGGIVREVAGP